MPKWHKRASKKFKIEKNIYMMKNERTNNVQFFVKQNSCSPSVCDDCDEFACWGDFHLSTDVK